jgi:hypothetical protein
MIEQCLHRITLGFIFAGLIEGMNLRNPASRHVRRSMELEDSVVE